MTPADIPAALVTAMSPREKDSFFSSLIDVVFLFLLPERNMELVFFVDFTKTMSLFFFLPLTCATVPTTIVPLLNVCCSFAPTKVLSSPRPIDICSSAV